KTCKPLMTMHTNTVQELTATGMLAKKQNSCNHTHIQTHIQKHIHTPPTHTHTHTHSHTHTRAHTYTHTHTHKQKKPPAAIPPFQSVFLSFSLLQSGRSLSSLM